MDIEHIFTCSFSQFAYKAVQDWMTERNYKVFSDGFTHPKKKKNCLHNLINYIVSKYFINNILNLLRCSLFSVNI